MSGVPGLEVAVTWKILGDPAMHGRYRDMRPGTTRHLVPTCVLVLLVFVGADLPVARAIEAGLGERAISVAVIGDSYSAGNGAGNYYGRGDQDDSVPDGEKQFLSRNNYANDYVDWLNDQSGVNARLTSALAHSGATTRSIVDGQIRSGRFSDDADLVVMTAGGNDLHFATVVEKCFAPIYSNGVECKQGLQGAEWDIGSAMDGTRAIFAELESRLRPGARVVLLGYPRMAPDNSDYGFCLERAWYGVCLDYFYAAAETRRVGERVDAAQQWLVDDWNAHHELEVTYIPAAEKFGGHEPEPYVLWNNPNRWINQIFETTYRDADGTPRWTYSTTQQHFYHPSVLGHVAYSELLRDRLGVPTSSRNVVAHDHGHLDMDIAFVVDTTQSMLGEMGSLGSQIQGLSQGLSAEMGSLRVGLVSYRDFPSRTGSSADYASRVEIDLTGDMDDVGGALGGLEAAGGGDDPDSVFSGIAGVSGLSWRNGARRMVIVVGDGPTLSPDEGEVFSTDDVARTMFELGSVPVYGIDTSDLADIRFQDLVDRTGGEIRQTDTEGIRDAVAEVIEHAASRPLAWLDGPYVARVGEPVAFDARGSFGVDADLTSYSWDFDGDGVVDETTTLPQASHTDTAPFDGFMGLTVTDTEGRMDSVSMKVDVMDGFGASDPRDGMTMEQWDLLNPMGRTARPAEQALPALSDRGGGGPAMRTPRPQAVVTEPRYTG